MKKCLILALISVLFSCCTNYDKELIGKWEMLPQSQGHSDGSATLDISDNMTYHDRFHASFDIEGVNCEININTEGRWKQTGDSIFFNGHRVTESNFTMGKKEEGVRDKYKIVSCSDDKLVLSNDSIKGIEFFKIK